MLLKIIFGDRKRKEVGEILKRYGDVSRRYRNRPLKLKCYSGFYLRGITVSVERNLGLESEDLELTIYSITASLSVILG